MSSPNTLPTRAQTEMVHRQLVHANDICRVVATEIDDVFDAFAAGQIDVNEALSRLAHMASDLTDWLAKHRLD